MPSAVGPVLVCARRVPATQHHGRVFRVLDAVLIRQKLTWSSIVCSACRAAVAIDRGIAHRYPERFELAAELGHDRRILPRLGWS